MNDKVIRTLKTGDLLLCNYEGQRGWFCTFTKMIKWGSHSNWSHCAMILKDPTFISPGLKGLYVWESSRESEVDPQDGKKKLGVQITPLKELLDSYKTSGIIIVRRIHSNKLTDANLKRVHDIVYDKPYDLNVVDWFEAFIKKDFTKAQKTDRFWCSALVACIYTKCGILDKDTDWSIVAPNDFDIGVTNQLCWEEGNYLTEEIKLI